MCTFLFIYLFNINWMSMPLIVYSYRTYNRCVVRQPKKLYFVKQREKEKAVNPFTADLVKALHFAILI